MLFLNSDDIFLKMKKFFFIAANVSVYGFVTIGIKIAKRGEGVGILPETLKSSLNDSAMNHTCLCCR